MANLAPTLQGAGFARSPVQGVEPVGTQLASGFLGALSRIPGPAKPSADDRSDATLTPFVQRVEEIVNESTLSPDQQTKAIRKVQRQVSTQAPSQSGKFNTILSDTYGIGDAVRLDSPDESLLTNINEWTSNHPEGQVAAASAALGNFEGQSKIDFLEQAYTSFLNEEAQLSALERQVAVGEKTTALSNKFWKANTRRAKSSVNLSLVPAMQIFENIRMNGSHELSEDEAQFMGLSSGTVNEANVTVFLQQYRAKMEEELVGRINVDGTYDQPTAEWLADVLSPLDTLTKASEEDFGSFKKIVETGRLRDIDALSKALKRDKPDLYNTLNLASLLDGAAQGILLQGFLDEDGMASWIKAYGASNLPPADRAIETSNMSSDQRVELNEQAVAILSRNPQDPVVFRNATQDVFDTTKDSYLGKRTYEALIVSNAATLNKEISSDPQFNQYIQQELLSDLEKTFLAARNATATANSAAVDLFIDANGKVGIVDLGGHSERGQAHDRTEELLAIPEIQLLQQKLAFTKNLPNGAPILGAMSTTHAEPVAPTKAHGIVTNKGMNPLLDNMEGASSMTKPTAARRMQGLLGGPFARLQNTFGSPLTINDGIAKAGTSREKNTPGSRHFHGDAIDVSIAGMSEEDKLRLLESALASGFQGFGFGKNILHIDLGKRRVWDYKSTGDTWGGFSVAELGEMVANGAIDRPAVGAMPSRGPGVAGGGTTLASIASSVAEFDEQEGEPVIFLDLEGGISSTEGVFQSSRGEGTLEEITTTPEGSGEGEVTASEKTNELLQNATRQQLLDALKNLGEE